MNKTEANALRIAELMGYKKCEASDILIWRGFAIDKESVILDYTKYDYLMPIVFECNININYRIHIYEECVIFSTADGEMLLPKLKYDLEPEFIEALQLACIKYLELRNEN